MNNSQDYKKPNDEYPDFQDIIIPLKICDADFDGVWIDPNINKYCPNFTDEHFIYGDYYSSPGSWFRLAIQFCDPIERASQGKSCKSEDEIEEYFSNTLVGLYSNFHRPSI